MNAAVCMFMFFTLIFSGSLLAKDVTIATITNDENDEVHKFVADINEATDDIQAFYKEVYVRGKMSDRKPLPTDQLDHPGLILEKRGGHNIINLKSNNFDFQLGGTVKIDTLYNGVNGQRKDYDLELAKTEEGWKLIKGKNQISKLHIITNKVMLIGAVGVKDIQMK